MQIYSSYKNLDDLNRLHDAPTENEKVYIEDIDTYYIWSTEQGWVQEEAPKTTTISGISLYDLNKQLVKQAGPLSAEQITEKCKAIIDLDRVFNNTFYLLYGQELHYFTVFMKDCETQESFAEAVIDCLYNIGTIYSIEPAEDKLAIEIWVASETLSDDTTCLYLFPYDSGIVPFGG